LFGKHAGDPPGGTASNGAVLYGYVSTTGMTAPAPNMFSSATIGSGGIEEVFAGASISGGSLKASGA
jgi:hypothetical protein